MFFSMREEELLNYFSKNSLRRRELKKNVSEKKRGGGKRREEGVFVLSHRSLVFATTSEKSTVFSSLFEMSCTKQCYHELFMIFSVTLDNY